MRFSLLFLLALLPFGLAETADSADAPEPAPEAAAEAVPEFSHNDFLISFQLNDATPGTAPTVYNEDTLTISYSLKNAREDLDVSVVGVGGSFKDLELMKPAYNLTDTVVGPVPVEAGKNGTFRQTVTVDMVPKTYVFAPLVYISLMGVMYVITPTPSFVVVDDKPLSLFDPQLLLALSVLGALLAGSGYAIYSTFGASYFKKTQKREAKKEAKVVKKVDESWLPEVHKKKSKTTKRN